MRPGARRQILDMPHEPGPAIEPADALLHWLTTVAATPRRLVSLPVTVAFTDEFRTGIGRVHVGTGGDRPANPILLELDDTGLSGSGVWQLIRDRCDRGDRTCTVWIDGYWGPVASHPPTVPVRTGYGKAWPFAVSAIRDRITAILDPEQTHALIARA